MILHYIRNNTYFFVGLSLGLLLNDFFERKYPKEFKIYREFITNLFVNASYNCIYYFSKFQIFTFQVKNNLNLFIEANPSLSKLRDEIEKMVSKNKNMGNIMSFVKDGKVYDSKIENYDFIINSLLNKDVVLRRLFYNNDEVNNIFEDSDIKFLLVEFKIGENEYKIDLKTDFFNYYLVDNKFTKDFFIFYIKIHLNKKDEFNNNDKSCLKIIDHNVNKIEFDFTDKNETIILEKTGYKLTITNHSDNR